MLPNCAKEKVLLDDFVRKCQSRFLCEIVNAGFCAKMSNSEILCGNVNPPIHRSMPQESVIFSYPHAFLAIVLMSHQTLKMRVALGDLSPRSLPYN